MQLTVFMANLCHSFGIIRIVWLNYQLSIVNYQLYSIVHPMGKPHAQIDHCNDSSSRTNPNSQKRRRGEARCCRQGIEVQEAHFQVLFLL